MPREVAPPIRLAAVGIGKAVLFCQAPRRQRLTCLASHVRIGGQRRHGAADVQRRLGCDEMRVLRGGVSPVGFSQAEMIEYGLRPRESRVSVPAR